MASTGLDIRFVRCPKCRQLIPEYANVPFYKCGGCGIVLEAKYHVASLRNPNSEFTESSSHKQSSEMDNDTETAKPQNCSSESSTAATTDAKEGASDHGKIEGRASHHDNVMCSDPLVLVTETNLNEEVDVQKSIGPSSQDHGSLVPSGIYAKLNEDTDTSPNPSVLDHRKIEGRASRHDSPTSTDSLALKMDTNLTNVIADKSLKSSSQDHDTLMPSVADTIFNMDTKKILNSSPRYRNIQMPSEAVEDCEEPASQNTTSEDNVFDTKSLRSAARSSHAYDSSASSTDDSYNYRNPRQNLALSRRTFKHKGAVYENDIKGKKVLEYDSQLEARNFPPTPSGGSEVSATTDSSSLNGAELSFKQDTDAPDETSSIDSEDYHSVQNWMEQGKYASFSSPSRDSVTHQDSLDGKGDAQSTKFRYVKPRHMKILRKVDELRDELTELFDQSEQVENTTQCTAGSYLSRQKFRKPFLSSPAPFSEHVHHSSPHRHHRSSFLPPSNINYHNGPSNFCPREKHINPIIATSPTQVASSIDHLPQNLRKQKALKRHCRPVLGGAPFVICRICLKLLQLPADFLVARRNLHKLQCGNCSRILVYSFRDAAPTTPRTPINVQHPPSEAESVRQDIRPSNYNDNHQGDPFSFTEEYDLSFARSESTEPETVLHVSRNSSELTEIQQVKGPQLHRLLGYRSARDILLRVDSIAGCQTTTPSTPENPTRQRLKGAGVRTSHHEHSAAGTSSNVGEHEEGELPMRSRIRRTTSPLRGLLKKGMRELNHGFETVKQKVHSNGKIIRAR